MCNEGAKSFAHPSTGSGRARWPLYTGRASWLTNLYIYLVLFYKNLLFAHPEPVEGA